MADPTVLEVYRRELTPDLYTEIRELYKTHSIAEDARDLPGLISTLTPDCVYELVQSGHRWEGHEGAAQFYTELLTAFPDIRFDLTDIVIGPQGVCEEADVSATHAADLARGPADRRAARVEGHHLVPVGRGAATLPRREGLRLRAPRPGVRGLVRRQKQTLTGPDRRRGEVVPLLELPDALADVAAVAARGDRPEGVGRLHDVGPLGPGAPRNAGHHGNADGRQEEDEEELPEHVFAILERTRVRVKERGASASPCASAS